jgi:hypothetical protein
MTQIVQAGKIQVFQVSILIPNGEGYDIKEQVDKISIYEDLFSPWTTGELIVRDTLDILNGLGRVSKPLLRIKLVTPGLESSKNIDRTFLIYKIGKREIYGDRQQIYKIHFASEELINDNERTISKTFSGPGQAIISQILERNLGSTKNFLFEPSNKNLRYTSNYWSATRNFKYICEHSIANSPTYVFYEDRSGFNFRTIETLGEQETFKQFFTSDYSIGLNLPDTNQDPASGVATRDPNFQYGIIKDVRVDSTFDYLGLQQSGAVATKLITHDLTTKQYKTVQFDMNEDSHQLLNRNKLMKEDIITGSRPITMTQSRYQDSHGNGDGTNSSFLQKRVLQMALYSMNKIEIDVFGRSDYTVGLKVNINMNQMKRITRDSNEDDYKDRLFGGNYIISAVAHHITRVSHECTFELIKDSTDLP